MLLKTVLFLLLNECEYLFQPYLGWDIEIITTLIDITDDL